MRHAHELRPLLGGDVLVACERLDELRARSAHINAAQPRVPVVEGDYLGTSDEADAAQVVAEIIARELEPRARSVRDLLNGTPRSMTPDEAWNLLGPHADSKGQLRVRDRTARDGTFAVEPGTPLSAMRDAAHVVSDVFKCDKESAGWWLLTGEIPFLSPMQVQLSGRRGPTAYRCRITVTAMAHVSAKSVAKTFASMVRFAFDAGPRGAAMHRRTMAHFVDQHRGPDGHLPASRGLWRELFVEWQKIVPDLKGWSYGDWRGMRRAYFHELDARELEAMRKSAK